MLLLERTKNGDRDSVHCVGALTRMRVRGLERVPQQVVWLDGWMKEWVDG